MRCGAALCAPQVVELFKRKADIIRFVNDIGGSLVALTQVGELASSG